MPREASLFDSSNRSVIKAYMLLQSGGSDNMPPNWIERARQSRKNRESAIALAIEESWL